MKKVWIVSLVVAWAALPECVWAQGAGGGGGRGGDFRQRPKSRLGLLIRGIGELEKGNKAALTKEQAKKIVALVKPWEKKAKMTDEEAKALYKKVNDVLTTKQKNELDKMAAQNRRSGGGGGGGGGGGFGGGGGGGQPPSQEQIQQFQQTRQKMEGFFKIYNPFYPPGSYKELKELPEQWREGFTKRYEARKELLTKLEKKAHGK